jgi:hypothetical protein
VIDNTLYYTFSTIAQTLAAAFGVLTAIVVVRLPAIENTVEEAKAILLTHHGERTSRERGACCASRDLVDTEKPASEQKVIS